jgi:hypothetical protein
MILRKSFDGGTFLCLPTGIVQDLTFVLM